MFQLQPFELTNLAGRYKVLKILSTERKPESLVELLKAKVLVVMKDAVD